MKLLTPAAFGLGLRPEHYRHVLEHRPSVDFFEVISENFFGRPPRPTRILKSVREHYPVAMHGVGLSIGSAGGLQETYLAKLDELARWLDPFLITDHLCWTRSSAHQSHDLLPMAYTKASLNRVARHVDQVQTRLGRRLSLENASAYVELAGNEMSEAEFYAELCRRTGCGILLDLNNVYVNYRNLGWDPHAYLTGLPKDAIDQFHLAGPSDEGDVFIDTHDSPVLPAVWELYRTAAKRWPQVPTLLEWDAKIPAFAALEQELSIARAIRHEIDAAAPEIFAPAPAPVRAPGAAPGSDHAFQAEFLATLTQGGCGHDPVFAQGVIGQLRADAPVPAARGYGVYHHAYRARITEVLQDLFSGLYWVLEDEGFHHLAEDFVRVACPQGDTIADIGAPFVEFIHTAAWDYDFGADRAVFEDLVRFEWAMVRAFQAADPVQPSRFPPRLDPARLGSLTEEQWLEARFALHPSAEVVSLRWDIAPIYAAAEAKVPPPLPALADVQLLVWNNQGTPAYRALSAAAAHLAQVMKSFADISQIPSLPKLAEKLTREVNWDQEELPMALVELAQLGVLGFSEGPTQAPLESNRPNLSSPR